MKNDKYPGTGNESFAEVVALLEKNLRYLESLGLDGSTLITYRKLIIYLKGRSGEEIFGIIGGRIPVKKISKYRDPDLPDEEISKLTDVQIKSQLGLQNVSRKFLERIAVFRFGVTKGALSTLRSREALIEKLFTLLEHENTHEAISRAATGNFEKAPNDNLGRDSIDHSK